MKTFYSFWLCLLVLVGLPLASFAQCSNQINVTYYNSAGAATTTTINNGQSGGTIPVCPTAGTNFILRATSTSNATLYWYKVVGTTETLLTSGVRAAGSELLLSTPLTTTTQFRIRSNTTNCNGGTSNNYADITLEPSLTLSSSVASICTGGTAVLTASGSANGTYTWYQDGVLQSETGATITRTGLTAATTFEVSAATASCGTSSQQLTVPVNSLSLTPTSGVVCSGGSATFTATYTGTSATFNWYNASTNALVQTTSGATTSTFTATNITGATSYRVEAVTADCGTTLSQTASVTVGALTGAVSPSAPTVCPGTALTLTASSNNPNATYQWQSSNNGNTYNNITGATSSTYTVFTASNNTNSEYYRVVVSSTNCSSVNVPVTIAKVASATNTISSSAGTVCAGSPVTLTAASNITSATYVWYITAGQSLSTSASYTPSPTATTTYKVDVTTGCGTQTLTSVVNVNAKPTITLAPSAVTIQQGNSTSITASGATTYSWSPNTGLSATTGATVTASPTTTTTYTVTGTNSNGCVNTNTITITVDQILPVELVEFNAVWRGQSPKLTWVTAFEKETSMFLIERSLDGVNFEVVGQKQAAGNSLNRTSYRFADGTVPVTATGTLYYRLHQLDATGSYSYSGIRTVQVPTKRNAFAASAYPNPYEGALLVDVETSSTEPITCLVYDVVGKRLISRKVAASGTISQQIELPEAATLQPGMYFLRVQQGNQSEVIHLNRK